jgi:hypothetical protein
MEIHTIGIDLGKTVFHLVGLSPRGEVVVRKKCSRNQLLRFTSNLRVSRTSAIESITRPLRCLVLVREWNRARSRLSSNQRQQRRREFENRPLRSTN